jgi:hypothetical protein
MKKIFLLTAFCLFILSAVEGLLTGVAGATVTPTRAWTDSGKVIAAALGDAQQSSPKIIDDGVGGAVAIWLDYRDISGAVMLYAQKLSSVTGDPQWTPTQGVTVCASLPSGIINIATDGAGTYFVVWEDQRSGAGSPDIYVQKLNSSGAPQWTANGKCVVANATLGGQYEPKIISSGDGGCVVSWVDQRGGIPDIRAQKLNASGDRQWGDDGAAVCTADNLQWDAYLTTDGAGGAIISFTDIRHGDFSNSDIYAQKVFSDGTVGGGNWITNGVTICALSQTQGGSRIVSDGVGGAIITWSDRRNATEYNIFAQRIKNNGTFSWLTDGVTICAAASDQSGTEIVTDGSNGAIISWADYRAGGGASNIYAQRVTSAGEVAVDSWPADGRALSTVATSQLYHQMVSDGAGGAIVTWKDDRSGGPTPEDIYAQRVVAAGTIAPGWDADGVAVCNNSKTQVEPRICYGGSNGAIFIWSDSRAGSDVYAQKFNDSGAAQWTANGKNVCTAQQGVAQTQPVLCAGTGVVAWIDARNGQNDIYTQKFDDSGNKLWGEDGKPVSVGTGAKGTLGGVVKTGSNYLIVWDDDRSGTSSIYAQLLDSSGDVVSGWTVNGVAVTTTSSSCSYAAVAPDGEGGGIIVWQTAAGFGGVIIKIGSQKVLPVEVLVANAYLSDEHDLGGQLLAADMKVFGGGGVIGGGGGGGTTKIYAKRIKSNGSLDSAWGTEADEATDPGIKVGVYDSGTLSQQYPGVVNMGGGSALVSWCDNRNGDTNFDIFAQKLAIANGARQWVGGDAALCTEANNQISPRMASLGDGKTVVGWTDGRDGRIYSDPMGGDYILYDVFAQRFDCSGSSPAAEWSPSSGKEVIDDTTEGVMWRCYQTSLDPAGSSFYALEKTNYTDSSKNVYLQALDSSGVKMISSPYALATYSGTKAYPGVAATGTGTVIASWDPAMSLAGGGDTDIHIQKITGLAEVPAAPSGFSGTAQSDSSIQWSWTDNSYNESFFDVFGSVVGTVVANTTSFLEEGLSPNTSYTRYVKARNDIGSSAASNNATVHTLSSAPSNPNATETGEDYIKLGWSGDGSSYKVEMAPDVSSPGTWTTVVDKLVATTYKVTGLLKDKIYWFRVSAYNADGIISLVSDAVSFMTSSVTIKAPQIGALKSGSSAGPTIINGDYIGRKISINVMELNPEGLITQIKIRFLDDSGAETAAVTYDSVKEVYDLPSIPSGPKTMEITVTNNYGRSTVATLKVNVLDRLTVPGGYGVMRSLSEPRGLIQAAAAGTSSFATLGYQLTQDGDITIILYDTAGQVMWKQDIPAGTNGGWVGANNVAWNGITVTGSRITRGLYVGQIIDKTNRKVVGKFALPIH